MGTMNLTNHLLIAMPSLADRNFHRTVTLICEHSDQGAIGLVINRPLDLTVSEICSHLKLNDVAEPAGQQRVMLGGPVQVEHGFILHQPAGTWEATLRIDDETGLSSSMDVLKAMAQGQGPKRALVALGYAGWAAGQLERELGENSWLTTPADPEIVFDLPYEHRWQAAAGKIGVDLTLLAGEAGHA